MNYADHKSLLYESDNFNGFFSPATLKNATAVIPRRDSTSNGL